MCGLKKKQAGGVAAPIGSQIFGEILPYLNLPKTENLEEEAKQIAVPLLEGMTLEEAQKELEGMNLKIQIEKEENENKNQNEYWIKEQFPKAGIEILEGKSVRVVCERKK